MAVSQRLAFEFARARAHQMATYGDARQYVEGKNTRQFTGGGACYGYHAIAAFDTARSQLYFRDKLSKRK